MFSFIFKDLYVKPDVTENITRSGMPVAILSCISLERGSWCLVTAPCDCNSDQNLTVS